MQYLFHCRMDKDQSFRKPEEENDYYLFEGKKKNDALTGERFNFRDTCDVPDFKVSLQQW